MSDRHGHADDHTGYDGTVGSWGSVMSDDHDEYEAPTRASRKRRQARRRRGGRRFVVLLLAVLLVGGGGYGAFVALRPMVSGLLAPKDYVGEGTGEVKVTIPTGASGRTIGRLLAQADVVKTDGAFVSAAQDNPKSSSIQPGEYTLRKEMSGAAALTLLLDPASRVGSGVTVREGMRATEVIALLSKQTGQPLSAYQKALKDVTALGVPDTAKGKIEGWLFPDTYEFGSDVSAAQQLTRMVERTHEVLVDLDVPPSRFQRVLTVASIAEVEASSPQDFAKVARVIENRLAGKLDASRRLQMDSTVAYAVGKRLLTTTSAQRSVDSPYNTYRYGGLPPGPVSNPGKAAIEGALHPPPGPWLFFVSVNPSTGETKFAATGAEHARNVKEFQAWCRANTGSC